MEFSKLNEGDLVFDIWYYNLGWGKVIKKLNTHIHIQFKDKIEVYDAPHCKFLSDKLIYVCDDKRHLVCIPFSIDGLHKMAEDLGIKRCWFHSGRKPHYDIPKRRIAEIKSKCKVWESSEILKIIKGV